MSDRQYTPPDEWDDDDTDENDDSPYGRGVCKYCGGSGWIEFDDVTGEDCLYCL